MRARDAVVALVAASLAAVGGGLRVDAGASRPDAAADARTTMHTCGALQVVLPGPTPLCTHGPDPAPRGVNPSVGWMPGTARSSTPTGEPPVVTANASAIPCYGDGVSGNRVQAVYAFPQGHADRFTQVVPSIRQWAASVNDVVRTSAAQTGGERNVRFVTDAGCQLNVIRVALTQAGDQSIATTVAEFQEQGMARPDRKYLVWMDSTVLCGVATYFLDDRMGQDNINNGNSAGRAPVVARIDSGCWGMASRGESVEAHELTHTLGAVQTTAPHATKLGHCTDDSDRMCYDDGSQQPMTAVCPSANEAFLDCNHDDYFSTAPPAGSYLAGHWNAASSSFLDGGAPVQQAAPPPPATTTTTEPPAPPVAPLAEPPRDGVVRLAGNDRIGSAIAASRSAYADGTANAVVLANSGSYADALPATPLAAAKHAPLLLTPVGALDGRVSNEISRVLPRGRTVYLVGGEGALSTPVADAVKQLGYSTLRLAGPSRYETATVIAREGLQNPATLFEVTGHDFADALAAGAAAAEAHAAILLTDGSTQSTATAQYLVQHPTAARVAIGGAAKSADPAAEAVAGNDRYETATQLAARFFPGSVPFFGAASGRTFPDGLSGGAHIATRQGPVILVPPAGALPASVASYLRSHATDLRGGWTYGGTGAVSEQVRGELEQAIT